MNENNKIKNKSLEKAMKVLNCFIDKQPLSVTEISDMLDLYKSNVSDILSTLAAMDYVEKDKESGKYFLGLEALRLGRAAGKRNTFQKIASKHIQEIAKKTGEICYLTIPQGFNVYYLDIADPAAEVPFFPVAVKNSVDSMNSTSSGKAMLAHMPEAFVNEYLATELPSLTEYTIVEPEKMRKELQQIRLRGYAVDNMENLIGMICVGVPLLGDEGNVIGAINVSGPSLRFTEEKIKFFSEILIQHAKEIRKIL